MRKFLTYYFLFLCSFFVILSSGVIDSQDGFQYLAVARNIFYTGKPTAPHYDYDQRKNIHMSTYVGKDGDSYSPTGLGYSLAMVPAVAVTDIFYKLYHVSPPTFFPLENDWLILMLASFTNSFFAAILGVVIYLYLLRLGISKKESLFISFAGLLSTNLFVYAKNSFAHMMFATFLLLTFYFIKKYSQTKNIKELVFSGAAFGVTSLAYNPTFILSVPTLVVYFLMLSKFKFSGFKKVKSFFWQFKPILLKFLFFLIGLIPFLVIYIWFENLRALPTRNLANPLDVAYRGFSPLTYLPVGVFFENLYSLLLSPGRGFFLYSPILILIIIFWHKMKKVIFPELIVFQLLSIIYIFFLSTQFSVGVTTQGVTGLWHGESSWGPRYLTPLIPFGLLVVGFIFSQLKVWQKRLIVLPLLLVGLYIEMLGVIMPYQIKFHDLQDKFYVNSTEFTNFAYSNFIPRFSPLIGMSKNLVKLYHSVPQTLDHGKYNVHFYDGVDFPFQVGGERWRVINGKGYINLDSPANSPVKKIALNLINHPMEDASYSATIKVSLNNKLLGMGQLKPEEKKLLSFDVPNQDLQERNNQLEIDVGFKSLESGLVQSDMSQYKDNPANYSDKNSAPHQYISQILGLVDLSINDQQINKESLDFPYISTLGPAMMQTKYKNYGGTNQDLWRSWEIHTQIYERVPDFWWFKSLYYWDVPKKPLLLLLAGMVLVCLYSGYKIIRPDVK